MRVEPRANPHPEFVFVDCEATGLAQPNHVISVGLAWCDGRSAVRLVKPHSNWRRIAWDPAALRIHGLTLEMLEQDGQDVTDVAAWLNQECAGRVVCSDAPEFDGAWLGGLFAAAVVRPAFGLHDAEQMALRALYRRMPDCSVPEVIRVYQELARKVREKFAHTHRADEDALSLAMVHVAAAA